MMIWAKDAKDVAHRAQDVKLPGQGLIKDNRLRKGPIDAHGKEARKQQPGAEPVGSPRHAEDIVAEPLARILAFLCAVTQCARFAVCARFAFFRRVPATSLGGSIGSAVSSAVRHNANTM